MKTNKNLVKKMTLSVCIMMGLITFSTRLNAQPTPLPERVISFKTSLSNESQITIKTNLWNDGEVWIYCGNGVWEQHTAAADGKSDIEKTYVIKNNTEELGVYGAIKDITITDAELVSIDFSKNPRYRNVTLSNNNLTHIDLSFSDRVANIKIDNNKNFISLTCNPTALTSIQVNNTSINNLNLSEYNKLTKLICHNCKLSQLDLSSNPQLNYLECYSNNIAGSNMTSMMQSLPSSVGEIYVFNSKADPADGNSVLDSDVNIATSKNWIVYDFNGSKDDSMEYNGITTSSFLSEFADQGLNIWGSKGTLHINNNFQLIGKFIEVYNFSGKMMRYEMLTNSETEIALPAGLYIVKIEEMVYKTVIF